MTYKIIYDQDDMIIVREEKTGKLISFDVQDGTILDGKNDLNQLSRNDIYQSIKDNIRQENRDAGLDRDFSSTEEMEQNLEDRFGKKTCYLQSAAVTSRSVQGFGTISESAGNPTIAQGDQTIYEVAKVTPSTCDTLLLKSYDFIQEDLSINFYKSDKDSILQELFFSNLIYDKDFLSGFGYDKERILKIFQAAMQFNIGVIKNGQLIISGGIYYDIDIHDNSRNEFEPIYSLDKGSIRIKVYPVYGNTITTDIRTHLYESIMKFMTIGFNLLPEACFLMISKTDGIVLLEEAKQVIDPITDAPGSIYSNPCIICDCIDFNIDRANLRSEVVQQLRSITCRPSKRESDKLSKFMFDITRPSHSDKHLHLEVYKHSNQSNIYSTYINMLANTEDGCHDLFKTHGNDFLKALDKNSLIDLILTHEETTVVVGNIHYQLSPTENGDISAVPSVLEINFYNPRNYSTDNYSLEGFGEAVLETLTRVLAEMIEIEKVVILCSYGDPSPITPVIFERIMDSNYRDRHKWPALDIRLLSVENDRVILGTKTSTGEYEDTY